MSLLTIKNLSIAFRDQGKSTTVARDISLTLERGETCALVGESGSGKSVTALSILKLLPYPQAFHPAGQIFLGDQEILGADESTMRAIRGRRIAMIFQEPMTSLNPLHTIEKQIGEVISLHGLRSEEEIPARIIELLEMVGFPEGGSRLKAYPHELSGGQRQRVMIAMALAGEPDLLIADEPTTALDVTTQAHILQLLKDLQKRFNLAILMISHDLGIVRKMAHQVVVMQRGDCVEQVQTREIFKNPKHPYTQHLLTCEPHGTAVPLPQEHGSIMRVDDLRVYFPVKSGLWRRTKDYVRAVDGISFDIQKGETLGIVGESGSGKSTVAQAILRLISSQGKIQLGNAHLEKISGRDVRPYRRRMQIVFQDPFGSLSPRMTVGDIVGEGLDVHAPHLSPKVRTERITRALESVSLDPQSASRYPHEFSGGQRQRIAIARALILDPELLILDEPTSALDRSIQVEILDLLKGIQADKGLSYIFISHDLRVVQSIAHQVLVMQKGKVVEVNNTQELFKNPQNPYTKLLINSAFT